MHHAMPLCRSIMFLLPPRLWGSKAVGIQTTQAVTGGKCIQLVAWLSDHVPVTARLVWAAAPTQLVTSGWARLLSGQPFVFEAGKARRGYQQLTTPCHSSTPRYKSPRPRRQLPSTNEPTSHPHQRFLLFGLLALRLSPLLLCAPPKGEPPKGVPAPGKGEPKPAAPGAA